MRHKLYKFLTIMTAILCFVSLSGCGHRPHAPVISAGMVSKSVYNRSAQAQLAEAAAVISKSLVQLEKIQQAATPALHPITPPDPASYGMADLASVDWSGPVKPILEKIALSTTYKVKVLGNAPPIPILVTVYMHNQPLGDILRNIGFQCGHKADVVVYPQRRVIELRYAKA